MKLFAKLFAVATAAVISLSAFAEGGTKTAVLDTGKGGIKVSITVPDDMNGPYDFVKNEGVKRVSTGGFTFAEIMFGAQVGKTGVVAYQAIAMKNDAAGAQAITAEHLANEILSTQGFNTQRATLVPNGPKVNIDGATVQTYKASGFSVFNGKEKRNGKAVIYVTAVSMAGAKQGYAIMATVAEKDVAAFDAEPATYDKMAKNAFIELFKGHKPRFD